MTRKEWQERHGLTDEDMKDIVLVREKFKADEIVVLKKGESQWNDLDFSTKKYIPVSTST